EPSSRGCVQLAICASSPLCRPAAAAGWTLPTGRLHFQIDDLVTVGPVIPIAPRLSEGASLRVELIVPPPNPPTFDRESERLCTWAGHVPMDGGRRAELGSGQHGVASHV